jgi:hypothetical protein
MTTIARTAIIRTQIVKRTRRGHMVGSLGYSRLWITLSMFPASSRARTSASTIVGADTAARNDRSSGTGGLKTAFYEKRPGFRSASRFPSHA